MFNLPFFKNKSYIRGSTGLKKTANKPTNQMQANTSQNKNPTTIGFVVNCLQFMEIT